jgi:hypothetical protein
MRHAGSGRAGRGVHQHSRQGGGDGELFVFGPLRVCNSASRKSCFCTLLSAGALLDVFFSVAT